MFDQRYEQLHSRISTVQRELSGEVQSETTKVMSALNDLRKEILAHAEKEEERIRHVERRQWMIMGACCCWIHTRKYEYYATLWIEKFFIMKYLVIDDNEKVHHLLKGRYENEDVLFYNANEAELRPDYDYRTL